MRLHNRLWRLMAGITLCLLLTRCNVITPQPTGTPIGATVTPVLATATPALNGLRQAHTIRIKDDWTGLSPLAPVEAHYSVHSGTDNFEGHVNFSVAGYSGHPRQSVEDILIPRDVVENFLRILAGTPLEKGEYVPTFTHTDDYPTVMIELGLKNTSVIFSSTSQGQGHAPWKIAVGDDEYISQSTVPAEALATLHPYLKQDVLRALVEPAR